MSLPSNFSRVTRRNPCPVCAKPDWCMVGKPDGEFAGTVVCQRTLSPRPFGAAGYFHRLHGSAPRIGVVRRMLRMSSPKRESMAELARDAAMAVSPQSIRTLADRLGVTRGSLRRLGVGEIDPRLASEHDLGWALGGWSFPMRDADGTVVGIRLRLRNGEKRSATGGQEGLFVPTIRDAGATLLICEGPTDTAAMLDLGFTAIGLPSCNGGHTAVMAYVQRVAPASVVIVSDADPAGRQGATALAQALVAYVAEVRIIEPPKGVKDARAWKLSGADAADIETAIARSKPWTLSLQCKKGA